MTHNLKRAMKWFYIEKESPSKNCCEARQVQLTANVNKPSKSGILTAPVNPRLDLDLSAWNYPGHGLDRVIIINNIKYKHDICFINNNHSFIPTDADEG